MGTGSVVQGVDAPYQRCGDLLALLNKAAHTECPGQGEAGVRKAKWVTDSLIDMFWGLQTGRRAGHSRKELLYIVGGWGEILPALPCSVLLCSA